MRRLTGFVAAVLFGMASPALASCMDTLWRLSQIDGVAFSGSVTLDLSQPGRLSGHAVCNRYFADLSGELPAFQPGPIASTKMACPDLADESAYFQALAKATEAELIVGKSLTLIGPDGTRLFFEPSLR